MATPESTMQLNPALVAALVACSLTGGAVGAVATLALRPAPAPAVAEGPAGDEPLPTDDAGEDDVVPLPPEPNAATVARLRALERKVSLLTAALARQGQGTDGGSGGAGPLKRDVADPVFEAAVLDIIDRAEDQRRSERQVKRKERRTEMARARVSELAPKLDLTDEQQVEVAQLMVDHFTKIRELRDSPDRPKTRSEWRQKIRELGEASEKKLDGLFTGDQKRRYEELDGDDKLRFTWGRGRRGGGRR